MDGLDGIENKLQMAVQATMQLNETLKALTRLHTGSFTMDAAATKVVSDVAVTANSIVLLQDVNDDAADLQAGTKRLYVSAKSAGVSFTVATQDATSAVGDEEFQYLIYSPV